MGIVFCLKNVISSALLSFLPLVPKGLPQRIKEESSKGEAKGMFIKDIFIVKAKPLA